jgi:hypothetical protein
MLLDQGREQKTRDEKTEQMKQVAAAKAPPPPKTTSLPRLGWSGVGGEAMGRP